MKITDAELILKLKNMIQKERDLVSEVLRHLREVESRQLYLARGYSSMFAFCTGLLGYSEAEAHIRIQAMRLIKSLPTVERQIEEGSISLSVAAQAQSCFRRERVGENEKLEIVNELIGASTRQAERKLAARFPNKPRPEIEKPISEELTRIEFTATKQQLQKFHRLKGLLAHKNFEGRYDLLFEELADLALKKLDAPLLGAPQGQKQRTRYIPISTRKLVWRRAGDQCQYRDPSSGKRCDCKHALQIDHIQEFANGGSNELENLQLLCGAHNRWRSQAQGA